MNQVPLQAILQDFLKLTNEGKNLEEEITVVFVVNSEKPGIAVDFGRIR